MAGMKFTADIDVKNIIKLRQEIDKLKNSLKAVAGIPNSDAAIKQLEKEIAAASQKLEEYKNKYLQIQKLKHDIDSSNAAIKKAKEETAALQSTNKWIVANTEAVIETDKQIKQLKKSFVSLADSEKTGSSGTGILRQVQQLAAQRLVEEESIRRTIKAQKDQIIQSRAEEGSITALRKQIILLTKDYDDLGRTRRNGDAGKALLAQIANVQKELSAAEQASGRFQRNVGNYASAWNGLSFSVQQVARELPSLAVSANTFFLAISNNLPILVDEIAKARKEYAAFKAEIAAGNKDVKAVAPVWRQLTKSLISWQTALVVGLTLLSVYGKDIINWINTLSRSSDAVDGMIVRMQNLSKVMKDGAKQSAAERVELDILYKATQDHTRLLKERNDAADELQRKYPQYFGNLSNEAILAGNAATAYKSLTDNILKAAQARSAMKIIEDNYNKIYQLQKAINADTNWTNRNREKTKEGTASVTAVVGSSITGYTQTGEVLTEEAMEYNRRKKALKENTEAVNALKAANDALVKSIDVSAFVANNGSPLGTEDIDSLTDQQNKIAELMDKQALEQKRSAEDMQMKIDEARIKAMDEGSKKTIAEIEFNFEKEMQAIDRQKEDLLRKKIDDARSIWEANPENKGKTFDATGISLSDSENQGFNEMYKIQIAAFEKNLKEYQSLQKDAWNEYYIEYGKYQEKRMAIMEKYDKQIAKAEEGSVEKATLTAQRKKELDDLDKELLDSSELWSKFFTDFSNRSSSSIRSIIEDIQELINYMNGVEGAQIPDIFKIIRKR